ncbi:MAG: LytR/AlgR family response regulator transcription factor [Flavobacteriales bacterium]
MIKAVIIDDEERASRVLNSLIEEYCPDVTVLAGCSSVPEAVLAINKHKPDVVFSDIEMPEYNGFDLLQFFDKPDFEIIFATGYSEYAIQAFEVSAVDYLLKPIQIEKLESAVDKLKTRLEKETVSERVETLKTNLESQQINRIALPISDGLVFIDVQRIELLEADGAYTNVCISDGSKLLVSKKIKYFESLLEDRPEFFRIHRSSIININAVKTYSKAEGYVHFENGKAVRIARDRKTAFEQHISSIRL